MKTDGTDKRQITRLGVMSWAPYYHPSGDYIIFANNAQGHSNFELYMVDVEGRVDPVRVTDTPGFDGLPVFTPDGNRLAWTSSRTGNRKAQIFMADWNDSVAFVRLEAAPGMPALRRDRGNAPRCVHHYAHDYRVQGYGAEHVQCRVLHHG